MFFRAISLSICMVLLMGALIGCGTPASDHRDETPKEVETVVDKNKDDVTITFWVPGADEANDTYFTNVAKEFETLNPHIKVETTVLPPSGHDINKKLATAMLSDDYPDVFSSYLGIFRARSPKGEFYDMTEYINKWSDKEDIFEGALNMGTYKGAFYGLAFFPAPEIGVYRKDYFEEAGLEPEQPPTTWEELAEYARKLVQRDNKGIVTRAGLDIPLMNTAIFVRTMMKQNGSPVVDEEKGEPSFTDEGAVETLDFIAKLAQEKVNIPFDYQKKVEIPFVKGNSAMSYLQTSQIAQMIVNDPSMKEKIGFIPVMERKKKVSFCGYRLFTIGAKTQYPDEAWRLIEFMMTKEQMMERSKQLNIPVVRKSLKEEFITLNPELHKTILEYVEYGKGAEAVPWVSSLTKKLDIAFQEAYNDKKSSVQALKDAEANLRKDLEKKK